MKKKPAPVEVPIVAKEILDLATRATDTDKLARAAKCTVCGSECSTTPTAERLCWVCRRLKISAWRDSDIQMNVQE